MVDNTVAQILKHGHCTQTSQLFEPISQKASANQPKDLCLKMGYEHMVLVSLLQIGATDLTVILLKTHKQNKNLGNVENYTFCNSKFLKVYFKKILLFFPPSK